MLIQLNGILICIFSNYYIKHVIITFTRFPFITLFVRTICIVKIKILTKFRGRNIKRIHVCYNIIDHSWTCEEKSIRFISNSWQIMMIYRHLNVQKLVPKLRARELLLKNRHLQISENLSRKRKSHMYVSIVYVFMWNIINVL